jgi:hypothetical protein
MILPIFGTSIAITSAPTKQFTPTKEQKMKRIMQIVAAAGVAMMMVSCGVAPTSVDNQEFGSLNLAVRLGSESGLSKIASTTYDSLIIRISASDMQTIRKSIPIIFGESVIDESMPQVPAGQNRTIQAWTVDKAGNTIHGVASATRDFLPNQAVAVFLTLSPASGSIYLQISEVPTSVDSIHALFVDTVSGGTWEARKVRAAKVSISLDRVPDGAAGRLCVAAVDTGGDTLYSTGSIRLVFHADSLNTIPLTFNKNPGSFALTADIAQPGATVGVGSMTAAIDTAESGALVISEIMYMANDSEYVELHNPAARDSTFPRLVLDMDGDTMQFAAVRVPAHGYLAIGRKLLSWTTAASSKLDLSSTTGNWLTLKAGDGSVIDRVAFAVKSNGLDWPNIASAKKSICLNGDALDAESNNYGRNWTVAASLIDGSASQYGTPGKAGI